MFILCQLRVFTRFFCTKRVKIRTVGGGTGNAEPCLDAGSSESQRALNNSNISPEQEQPSLTVGTMQQRYYLSRMLQKKEENRGVPSLGSRLLSSSFCKQSRSILGFQNVSGLILVEMRPRDPLKFYYRLENIIQSQF